MVFTTLVYLAFAANVASLPPGKGKAIVQRDCKGCHTLKVITSKRASREQWSTVVDQMVSRGADVPDEEIETVVDYLAKNFGAAKKQPTAKKLSPAQNAQCK
jgi:mono/diheme cytochrome c family protein